jgi:hypothetical protein
MASKTYSVEYVNLFPPAPPGSGSAYPAGYPDNTDVHPGNEPYYVTYPYAVGTLPFFFFVRHHHEDHRDDFHS